MGKEDEVLSSEEIDELTIVHGRALKKLIDRPEWETYKIMLEARIEAEVKRLSAGCEGFGDVFAAERRKGEIQGLRMALAQPGFMVEAAEKLLSEKLEKEETDG